MKQVVNLIKVENIPETDKVIGEIVVVTETRRISSVMDMIVTSNSPIKFESVQVPAEIIGGTRKTHQAITSQGWFRPPVKVDIVETVYAVKKKDGKVLLVDEANTVPVYDKSIWASDSDPATEAPKAKKVPVKKTSKN